MAAPGWNPLPEPIDDRADTVVVSAEEIDHTANAFDRSNILMIFRESVLKCDPFQYVKCIIRG